MDNMTDCHNATLDQIEGNWIGLGCLGILHLILGIAGLLANKEVLNELKLVKLSKLVNNLTHNLAWCCMVSSGCQMVTGLRLFYKLLSVEKFGWILEDYDEALVDMLIILWYFFTMLIHILVAYMGITRYVFVFKKSLARSMQETPAYTTLAGNFVVWSCILCTCSVETTLLDSGLYTLWSMGNETFLNAGFFIPIILHHLIMLTLDFLAFHLYQKINDRLTDKQVADGSSKSTTQVDFHNILELASGKPPPSKDTTDSSNRRIEDDQDHRHRHHNFVPWRIHRQVLICTTVASSILILAFIFISLFCGNQWSFWIFHVILTIQVSLTSLGPALCQLKHFSREKIKRRFVAKQQCKDEEDLRRNPTSQSHLSRDHLNTIQPPNMAERSEEAETEDDRKTKGQRRASIKQAPTTSRVEEAMSTSPPSKAAAADLLAIKSSISASSWSDQNKRKTISRSKYWRWQLGKTASLPNIHHRDETKSCSGYMFASILNGQVNKTNKNTKNTKKWCSSLWRRKVEKFPTVSVIYKPANSSSVTMMPNSSSRSSSLSPSSSTLKTQTMLLKKAVGGGQEQFCRLSVISTSSRELLSASSSASQKRLMLGRRNMETDVERCQEQREARRMTGNQGLPSID